MPHVHIRHRRFTHASEPAPRWALCSLYGAAVQVSGPPPDCNVTKCFNPITNATECCTGYCNVLGTGTPIWCVDFGSFATATDGRVHRSSHNTRFTLSAAEQPCSFPRSSRHCRNVRDPTNLFTGGVTLTYYGVPPAAAAPYQCGTDKNGADEGWWWWSL